MCVCQRAYGIRCLSDSSVVVIQSNYRLSIWIKNPGVCAHAHTHAQAPAKRQHPRLPSLMHLRRKITVSTHIRTSLHLSTLLCQQKATAPSVPAWHTHTHSLSFSLTYLHTHTHSPTTLFRAPLVLHCILSQTSLLDSHFYVSHAYLYKYDKQ